MKNSLRPKVLHLRVVAGTGGGPEKTILNSPRFIKPFGYDAQVAYLASANDAVAETLRTKALENECPLTIFDDRGPLDLRLVWKVAQLCRREKINILQAHDYKSNFLGLLVRRLYRCHLATMLHGWTDMSGRMPLYKKIDQWCLPKYRTLICVSEDLVEECRRLRIPESRIHLVHNAIDTQQFARRFTVESAKQNMHARPGRFLVGSVGRLSPEKCFSELIDVVLELQRKGLPIDLWIAGDGPQRGELEAKIQSLGCQESVRLLGQLKDTREFFQAMDLFVLNSIREGLPNVILEAMALEVPVIATRIAGIPKLIQDGRTGRLIEPMDSAGLRAAIEFAIQEPQETASLAKEARRLIESDFAFDVRMKKIAAIYDQLLLVKP